MVFRNRDEGAWSRSRCNPANKPGAYFGNPNQDEQIWSRSHCNPANKPHAGGSRLLELIPELRLQVYRALFIDPRDEFSIHIEPTSLFGINRFIQREALEEYIVWLKARARPMCIKYPELEHYPPRGPRPLQKIPIELEEAIMLNYMLQDHAMERLTKSPRRTEMEWFMARRQVKVGVSFKHRVEATKRWHEDQRNATAGKQ